MSRIKFFFLLILATVFASISGRSQNVSAVLATIGDKKITVGEFLQRSEFNVRPNSFKDKKTTLNNLIVEKILALESENSGTLGSNPFFQARLKGLKEQAMRENLYYEVAFNKAQVDTVTLKKRYKLSIREYEVEFYRMQKNLAQKVKTVIDDTSLTAKEEIFNYLAGYAGKQPVHKVIYKDQDDNAICEALYSKPLEQGDIVGPIELNSGGFMVMKILDWTAYPLLSGIDQQKRWKEVKEKEHRFKAMDMWRSYQAAVMRGKRMDFNGKTFNLLSNWVRTKYITEQQKIDSTGFQMPEIPAGTAGLDLSQPLFTFENKTWTVGDLRNELMSHPLVFRTPKIDSASFKEQFKLAIVDVMRDHCVTAEAYDKKLDRMQNVGQTVEMWRDAFVANNTQKTIVDAALKEGKITIQDEPGILHYWESYVRDLQKKYSKLIHINTKVFETISLTKIDMVAIKFGMPYPAVVPDFPVFISSQNLDYAASRK